VLFYRTFADTQSLRHLAGRQIIPIGKHDYRPLLGAQRQHSRPDLRLNVHFIGDQVLARRGQAVTGLTAAAGPMMGMRGVENRPVQVSPLIDDHSPRGRSQATDNRILDNVFGHPGPHQPGRELQQFRRVTAVDGFSRILSLRSLLDGHYHVLMTPPMHRTGDGIVRKSRLPAVRVPSSTHVTRIGPPERQYRQMIGGAVSSFYPLDVEIVCADRVPRWRPIVNWALVIPLYLWMTVLTYGAGAVSLVGWFAIVITGRLPQRMGDYLVAVLRYQWRVYCYLYGFTDSYPGFRAVAGYVDPGSYPAVLYSACPTARRRLTVVFRAVLVIPQLIVLYFVTIGAFVVLVIGWFAVLFTGRWPQGLQTFVIGWLRWTLRVNAYWTLLLDQYPPFRIKG
jgi:Domain of unknown function (DUF4389)